MKENLRWFYLRDDKEFPVACIASRLVNPPDGNQIEFTVSIHNPKDNYDSELGKKIAVERLIKNRRKKITTIPKDNPKGQILAHLASPDLYKSAPQVRKAAIYRIGLHHLRDLESKKGVEHIQGPH